MASSWWAVALAVVLVLLGVVGETAARACCGVNYTVNTRQLSVASGGHCYCLYQSPSATTALPRTPHALNFTLAQVRGPRHDQGASLAHRISENSVRSVMSHPRELVLVLSSLLSMVLVAAAVHDACRVRRGVRVDGMPRVDDVCGRRRLPHGDQLGD